MAWPKTDDPRTEFVTLRFTVSEAADLDWLAALQGNSGKRGPNRSAAARDAIGRVVTAEKRRQKRSKENHPREQRTLDAD